MTDTITTGYRASHVIEVEIPQQDILDLLDSAGYGIAYWARRAHLDEDKGTYKVWLDAPAEIPEYEASRTIEFEWIARMILRLAAGDPSLDVSPSGQTAMACRRYIGTLLAGDGDPDFDSIDADIIVQLCYFRGKVVFG